MSGCRKATRYEKIQQEFQKVGFWAEGAPRQSPSYAIVYALSCWKIIGWPLGGANRKRSGDQTVSAGKLSGSSNVLHDYGWTIALQCEHRIPRLQRLRSNSFSRGTESSGSQHR